MEASYGSKFSKAINGDIGRFCNSIAFNRLLPLSPENVALVFEIVKLLIFHTVLFSCQDHFSHSAFTHCIIEEICGCKV
ncbi:hypothetical protein QVD17_39392 [Tagetes erecta]|uniref:Uncharacterized protein n=1 Tax=Tagetes erecta TaxID=13708 RepID=A0AAD8JNF8_TARER|nr:hypothetical protein QVD17_39392 [Tagetes erecta]